MLNVLARLEGFIYCRKSKLLLNIILADEQTENDRKEQTGQKQTSFILGFKNITIYQKIEILVYGIMKKINYITDLA